VVLLLAAATQVARADVVNLATGLDAGNNLISTGGVTDAHWTATVDPTYDPTGTAQTVYPNNADWGSGGWLGNGPNSDWIARNANVTNNGPAPYMFTRTFDLTGFNPATASITGSWAIDDAGTLSLNGHVLATLGSGAWGALTPFSVSGGSGDFLPGLNTLTITITSDDQFLEGVRLEGALTRSALSAVAEPSPLALGALGALAAGAFCRWKRRPGARA
jgi:hypothetical protein